MRLLKTGLFSPDGQAKLQLEECHGDRTPAYAVVSHTWESDEVLFADVQNGNYVHKLGYSKVAGALKQALEDGHSYLWLDTCCIDKSSSAELSEAINSMYAWYQGSAVCYAFLADVAVETPATDFVDACIRSRWWRRGWTLQELLAPRDVLFFDNGWHFIGTKMVYKDDISKISGIESSFLDDPLAIDLASIAKRMSWMAGRSTTREEDMAYCLLGIFSINMPMLYGEGNKAFLRLQTAIMSNSDDQSLFAWVARDRVPGPDEYHGLLADSPYWFSQAGNVFPYTDWEGRKPYSMSNRGLSIELPLTPLPFGKEVFAAALQCPPYDQTSGFMTLHLKKLPGSADQYARVAYNQVGAIDQLGARTLVYVKQHQNPGPQNVVYPHHFFVLGSRDDSNVFYSYQIARVVPDQYPTSADSSYYPKPSLKLKTWTAHSTMTAQDNPLTVYKIAKKAGKLSAGIVLRKSALGTATSPDIAVSLGSRTDLEVGFDICEVALTTPTYRRLQSVFEPQKMGTIMELGIWKFTVTSREHIESGRKIYYVDIFVGRAETQDTTRMVDKKQSQTSIVRKAIPNGMVANVGNPW